MPYSILRCFLIGLCVQASVCCYAQQRMVKVPKTLDSLEWFLKSQPVDTVYTLAMKDCAFTYIIKGEYARADSLRAELEKLRGTINYYRIDYFVPFIKATYAYHHNDPQGCLRNFKEALAALLRNQRRYKPETRESALNNVSVAFSRAQLYDSAMHYALMAIRVQEQYHFTDASAYLTVGNVLTRYQKYDQALPYYKKAQEINTANNHIRGLAIVENKLGALHHDMGRFNEAMTYYQAGLYHAEEANYPLLQADVLINLGLTAVALEQFARAEAYFKRGEKLSRTLQNTESLKTNLHNQGELYREMGKYTLAEQYYLEALALARQGENHQSIYTAHQALAELYRDTKDYAKAFDYLTTAGQYKDSIFQTETADKVQELLLKYEADKKQQEIELLNQQNMVQRLQLTVKRRNELLLLAGIIAVAAGVVFVYRRYRLKNQLEVEKVRTSIAADFHDELGANLSSIALYSDLLMKNPGIHTTQTTPLLENINQNARQTVSAISDLIWTIKPDNDILEGTLLRMKEFSIPLMEAKNIAFDFAIQESLRSITLDMTTRKVLYLVFKEAINNAMKYADATKVVVTLAEQAGWIVLDVTDNGVGCDLTAARRGNGLVNMKTRASQIQGELTISMAPGKGCSVTLRFKAR